MFTTVDGRRAFVERWLNDAVLGFLALVSLFLMVTPTVFDMGEEGAARVLVLEYLIILLFGLEYLLSLSCAPDKRDFLTNRWRVLDALIIVAALVTLFPFGPDVLRNSPVLRLIRLSRVALLGTRSGVALRTVAGEAAGTVAPTEAELLVHSLGPAGDRFDTIDFESALARIRSVEPDWLFISGVSEDLLAPVADAMSLPVTTMLGLFQSNVPRLVTLGRSSTLFVRYPLPMSADGRLRRTPLLLTAAADNVVVLSRENTDLEQKVEARIAALDPRLPGSERATLALVGEVVNAYTDVLVHIETALSRVEVEQLSMRDEMFLSRSFELRADILRVRSSLKHLRSVLRDLAQGRIALAGSVSGNREAFLFLADDVGELYEDVEDVRESLQALVDLRLNVSSFQMNRVMRLLALLTALALIPATAGGLLGMNLLDAPWAGTLPQVAFGVAAGMALSLYIFAIKGWMR